MIWMYICVYHRWEDVWSHKERRKGKEDIERFYTWNNSSWDLSAHVRPASVDMEPAGVLEHPWGHESKQETIMLVFPEALITHLHPSSYKYHSSCAFCPKLCTAIRGKSGSLERYIKAVILSSFLTVVALRDGLEEDLQPSSLPVSHQATINVCKLI